jgi:hypothetical protein
MSIFKKTRLDRPVVAENSDKKIENSYPRINEDEMQDFSTPPVPKIEPTPNRQNSPKTINPYTQSAPKPQKSVVRLTPIAKENETQASDIIMDEPSLILNRANTDPNNPTISAKGHALLEIKNGKVYISNETVAETTFVQAKYPTALRSGDVILLGDRLLRIDIELAQPNGLDD